MLWVFGLGCVESETQPRPVCDALLTATTPADGEDVIGTNAWVELSYEGSLLEDGVSFSSEPEAPWDIEHLDGRVLVRPSEALEPFTEYKWSATLCESEAEGSFTTRTLGEMTDPADLPGRTFGIDLALATWVEPANGAELMQLLFGGIILLGVESVDDSLVDFMGAVGEGDSTLQQDPCYETIDFEPVDFRNPYFELGPAEMPLEVQGQEAVLHDLQLIGAFDTEGYTIQDASMVAQGDMRDIGNTQWQDYCELASQYGLECSACSSDGRPACIDLRIEEIEAELIGGLVIQPVYEPSAECGQDTGGPK